MKRTLLSILFVGASSIAAGATAPPTPLRGQCLRGMARYHHEFPVRRDRHRSISRYLEPHRSDPTPVWWTLQFAGLVIDSVEFEGISGLPLGLAVACNSQTPAACTYLTGQLGCGLIEGTPTAVGTFPLMLNVLATVPSSATSFRCPTPSADIRSSSPTTPRASMVQS